MMSKSNNGDKEIFQSFLAKLLNSWYWFALCISISLMIAYFYLKYTVPTYSVEAKILISDTKKGGEIGSSGLGELSGMVNIKSSVENEVEVLKTADLMQEMVLQENGFISIFKDGPFNEFPVEKAPFLLKYISNIYDLNRSGVFTIHIFSDRYEIETEHEVIKVQPGHIFSIKGIGNFSIKSNEAINAGVKDTYIVKIRPLRQVSRSYLGRFDARVTNEKVSTIDLSFQTNLPKQGERFLSSIINKYVERNLEDKNKIADSTMLFISERLAKITQELTSVEDNISGYKKENSLANIEAQSNILIQNSADFDKNIAGIENQIGILDALESYLEDKSNPRLLPSAVIPGDATFNILITKYNDLILQRQRLLLANTLENPMVKNVDVQIQGLQEDIIQNVASTKRQLSLQKAGEQKLANQVTSKISNVPSVERGYIDLARLQSIKQAQYIFLQEKWEETAIGRTATVANSKIIDAPKVKDQPLSPKRGLVYSLALALGFMCPLIVLYLRDLLNVKIQSVADIQELTNQPILGYISHSRDTDQVVVTKSSRSAIAEQFRAVRTNLEFALNGGKVILFTSSMSGEGKSYVALNLAVSLALLDKKVLIMELDLRKPSITTKLGLDSGKGFSHYIVRPEMTVDEIISSSGMHQNVDLIQAGAIPPNPAELLVHPRTLILMNQLTEKYDYILMDAPPVGMVTDAQLLARYSDLCLYLVRQGYTYKEQLRIPNDLVENKKIKSLQLIVNDVMANGGYYSNYGYGYGYGYGDYGQNDDKSKWWEIFKRK